MNVSLNYESSATENNRHRHKLTSYFLFYFFTVFSCCNNVDFVGGRSLKGDDRPLKIVSGKDNFFILFFSPPKSSQTQKTNFLSSSFVVTQSSRFFFFLFLPSGISGGDTFSLGDAAFLFYVNKSLGSRSEAAAYLSTLTINPGDERRLLAFI